MKKTTIAIAAAVALGGLTLGGAAALASDEHGRERGEHHRGRDGERQGREEGEEEGDRSHRARGRASGPIDPTYAKECGACHLAFPPSMLSAGAWRTMLGGLDRHFGQDAALDDATRARLEGYLASQAGDGGGAEQRITRSAWFQRKHREVPAGVTSRPAIGSMANCAACHQDAARWDFDEHRVRIPR
jgi:hypothetical protein